MKPLSLPLLAAIVTFPVLATAGEAVNEIVITATRLSSEPVGSPVYVITRDEIENSTARSIAELLTRVPGLSVQQLSGNTGMEGTVDLRGFGAAASVNTLILVDGRRLNDVDLESTSLAGLPLANIERIEVQPGGGSVLYGDGASGGTINIITRRATTTGGSASIAAGSFDSREALATAQLASGGSAVGLFGQHLESDGYRANSQLRRENGGVNLRTTIGQQELFLSTQGSRLDTGLPGNRIVNAGTGVDEVRDDPRGTSTPDDWGQEERLQTVAGWQAALTDDLSVVIDASQRHKRQKSFYDYGGGFSDYTDTSLDTLALTPRLRFDYRTGELSHHLQTGLDWYRTDYTSKRGAREETPPSHTIGIDSETTSPYLFQTSRWQQTSLSLGARHTRAEQQGQDLFDPTVPFNTGAPAGELRHDEEMYEAGLSQEVQPGLIVRFGASRSVRLGTVDETYEFDSLGARVFSPLLPQVGHNVEGSLQFSRDGLRLTFTGYRQHLRNEIAFSPATFTNDNLPPTTRSGNTLALGKTLPFGLSVDTSVTVQKARFREGANAGNTVPLVPGHIAYAGVSWAMSPLWLLTVSDTYTGSKYFDNDSSNSFGQKIPGYQRVDAKLGLRWLHLQASLGVYNLMDERDHFDYGIRSTSTLGRYNAYPLPDRSWRLEVGASF